MKKHFFFFAIFLWSGIAYATDPAPMLGIRIDTAYIANDMHIELEYSVLVPLGKVHLSVFTSVDAHLARQNSNVPLTLSGVVGSYKRRVPVNLPQGQIVEFFIHLNGVEFANSADSTKYAISVQKGMYAMLQNGEVVNYRTTYTEAEKLVLEANLKYYRIYNSEGKLTDGWGTLIEVDSQGREINADTTVCRKCIYASDPLVLNRDEILNWENSQSQSNQSLSRSPWSITITGFVDVPTGGTPTRERISGSKVYMFFYHTNTPSTRYHPTPNNGTLLQGIHFSLTDVQGNFSFNIPSATADLTKYNRIGFIVASENDYVSLQGTGSTYNIPNPGTSYNVVAFTYANSNDITFNPSSPTHTTSNHNIVVSTTAIDARKAISLKWFQLAGELAQQLNYKPSTKIPVYFVSISDFGQFTTSPSLRINLSDLYSYDSNINGSLFPMRTAAHEYGHYVHYFMWGANSSAWSAMTNASVLYDLTEAWSVFYSYASRHFAYRKGIAIGGVDGPDLRTRTRDNLSLNSFSTPRFDYMNYPFSSFPAVARGSSFLWNLYDGVPQDGTLSYSYQASGANFNTLTDNDDIAMPGRVFLIFNNMKNVSTKSMINYLSSFHNGFSDVLRNSVNSIYNNMMSTATTPPVMRSGNFATSSITLSGSTLSLSFTYQPFDFPNTLSIPTRNSPTGLVFQRQRFLNSPWITIATVPYVGTTVTYGPYNHTVTDANLYNYKLAVYNTSSHYSTTESAYPRTIINTNSYAPTFNFYLSLPYSVSPYQYYSFSLSNITGIVSDVSSNYTYNWYADTNNGWVSLGTGTSIYAYIDGSTKYRSIYQYNAIDIYCVGQNSITGQWKQAVGTIYCSSCSNYFDSTFRAPPSLHLDEISEFASKRLNANQSPQPEINQADDQVSIYPNPVGNILHVILNRKRNYTHMRIFDASGNVVKNISPVNQTNQINVQDLLPGNYILMLIGRDTQQSFRFIKE